MESKDLGNSSRLAFEIAQSKLVPEMSAAKKSASGQNEMRSVLSQMITCTARSVLGSINFGKMGVHKKTKSVAAKQEGSQRA